MEGVFILTLLGLGRMERQKLLKITVGNFMNCFTLLGAAGISYQFFLFSSFPSKEDLQERLFGTNVFHAVPKVQNGDDMKLIDAIIYEDRLLTEKGLKKPQLPPGDYVFTMFQLEEPSCSFGNILDLIEDSLLTEDCKKSTCGSADEIYKLMNILDSKEDFENIISTFKMEFRESDECIYAVINQLKRDKTETYFPDRGFLENLVFVEQKTFVPPQPNTDRVEKGLKVYRKYFSSAAPNGKGKNCSKINKHQQFSLDSSSAKIEGKNEFDEALRIYLLKNKKDSATFAPPKLVITYSNNELENVRIVGELNLDADEMKTTPEEIYHNTEISDFQYTLSENLVCEKGTVGNSVDHITPVGLNFSGKFFDDVDQLQLRLTGRLGEFVACKYFMAKVGGEKKVNWVNETNETGYPYDIRIVNDEGSVEYIEVKTSRFKRKKWFFLSH